MWVIASVPFWIIGGLALLGAFASIRWNERTTDDEISQILTALIISGSMFFIASWVAS